MKLLREGSHKIVITTVQFTDTKQQRVSALLCRISYVLCN